MTKRKTLAQLAEDLYESTEIRNAVIASAKEAGTVERIEAGELHLPSEMDAFHWHRRITGQQQVAEETFRDRQRIAELELQFAAWASRGGEPKKTDVEDLRQRLAAIEQGRQ